MIWWRILWQCLSALCRPILSLVTRKLDPVPQKFCFPKSLKPNLLYGKVLFCFVFKYNGNAHILFLPYITLFLPYFLHPLLVVFHLHFQLLYFFRLLLPFSLYSSETSPYWQQQLFIWKGLVLLQRFKDLGFFFTFIYFFSFPNGSPLMFLILIFSPCYVSSHSSNSVPPFRKTGGYCQYVNEK